MGGVLGEGGGLGGGADGLQTLDADNDMSELHVWRLLAATLLNGLCYCIYNQTSFLVLSRVSFVTHATLNVMRRVVIICATSWFFATTITHTNFLGICLAIGGFAYFLYVKVHVIPLHSALPK